MSCHSPALQDQHDDVTSVTQLSVNLALNTNKSMICSHITRVTITYTLVTAQTPMTPTHVPHPAALATRLTPQRSTNVVPRVHHWNSIYEYS